MGIWLELTAINVGWNKLTPIQLQILKWKEAPT